MSKRRGLMIAILGVALSGLAIAIVTTSIDGSLVVEALRNARYEYLIPSLLLVTLGLTIRAWRWWALIGGGLPLLRAFHIINITYFVNGVLPLRIGELARAYLAGLGDRRVPPMRSLGSIVVERLLDVLAVIVLMGIGIASAPAGSILPDVLTAPTLAFIGAVIVGFGLAIVLAARRQQTLGIVRGLVTRLPALKRLNVELRVGQVLDGFAPLTRPREAITALTLTALSWGVSVASAYVLMPMFYNQANLAAILLATAAASLAVAVPAVPGSLGTYELSIILALGVVGLGEPLEAATLFAVTIHAVNLLMNVTLGVYGMAMEGVTLSGLSSGVRALGEGDAGETMPTQERTRG